MTVSKHYTPRRVAEIFVQKRLGREFPDDLSAAKAAKYDELTFGLIHSAITSASDAVGDVWSVIRQVVYEKIREDFISTLHKAYLNISNSMRYREEAHGPCPSDLRAYLIETAHNNALAKLGHDACYTDKPVVWGALHPPDKDHAMRAKYNQWMKRTRKTNGKTKEANQ